jgi:hypothetical protein
MIIVVADKWTHFDTRSLLPSLQYGRPSEHSNIYMCCLLQRSKTLRLIYVQFVVIITTTNCTQQLARQQRDFLPMNPDFLAFQSPNFGEMRLFALYCLSVRPSGTVARPSSSQRCCRNCDSLGKWVCVVSVAPDVSTNSSACISGLSETFS